jgi:hypothetical protein
LELQEQTRCFTIFDPRNSAVKKHPYFLALMLLGLLLSSACSRFGQDNLPELTAEQTEWIGERIFANECNLKIPCLTSWNAGEDFPSLGIGHFIWYRGGQQDVFVESFPALLAFYEEKEVAIPQWIAALPERQSPWPDRISFLADLESPRMMELRDFLNNTQGVQVEFIIERMHASLPALIEYTDQKEAIAALFQEIAASAPPLGMYALIDYVNFKGEGISESERYAGEGWGLLQVLEQLLLTRNDTPLMAQFSRAAKVVLARRIANAPADRDEGRWREGWNARVATYFDTR